MEYFIDFFSRLLKLASSFLLIFNRTLFSIGESEISIGTIIIFFLSFYLLVFTSTKARKLILNRILYKSKLKKPFRESIAVYNEKHFENTEKRKLP